MELEEAEQATIREGRRIVESNVALANVRKPRDSIEEWEYRTKCQREGLAEWAEGNGCLLSEADLPENNYGPGGQEHIVYHDVVGNRFWKLTFPNQSGFGPTGFFTPAGYSTVKRYVKAMATMGSRCISNALVTQFGC